MPWWIWLVTILIISINLFHYLRNIVTSYIPDFYKIWTCLLIVIILLINRFIYENNNQRKYIPKSRQHFQYLYATFNTTIDKLGTFCERTIQKWTRTTHSTRKSKPQHYKTSSYKPKKCMKETRRNMTFLVQAALAMQATKATNITPRYENVLTCDTDSASIGVDNRCTACISHIIDDFEGPLTDSGRVIKGFLRYQDKTCQERYHRLEMA